LTKKVEEFNHIFFISTSNRKALNEQMNV